MVSPSDGPFLPQGGYRRLRSYKVAQAPYLLRRQFESQGRVFLEKGGFAESLYTARTQARRQPAPSDPPDPPANPPH